MEEISKKIKEIINQDDVVLFMKGTPDFPQGGFSANVVGIFNHYGIEYKSYNVLEDLELREGIKSFSDWPTIPQIYIKNEFIGGFDILRDMLENNEIEDLLKKKEIKFNLQD